MVTRWACGIHPSLLSFTNGEDYNLRFPLVWLEERYFLVDLPPPSAFQGYHGCSFLCFNADRGEVVKQRHSAVLRLDRKGSFLRRLERLFHPADGGRPDMGLRVRRLW